MPDLNYQIEGAEAVPFTASPLLAFKLRITNTNVEESIQTVALRCQIQIESARRKYDAGEQERLLDLFGEPERWSRTLRPMLWTHASVIVTPFQGSTLVDLPIPCTFDFNVAAAKYFAGLENGEVPLNLMFSGTVFYETRDGALQVEQIPWDREAKYRLPVRVWKEMMDIYYPNSAWLCLRRDIFDRLSLYKMRRGIPTWEQTLDSILPAVEKTQPTETEIQEINIEEIVQ
ncbi:MAG TPA: DUF6084 family protein [Pyrinomonadaceae bacterium]|jgi:hypothetical protein|nr:DUF6084 family protein [Pyrinomonadaceae bacterium]